MNILKNSLKFFIYGNILISLAACFFFWSGYIFFNRAFAVPPSYALSFVFLSTFIIYNLNFAFSGKTDFSKNKSPKQLWLGRYKDKLKLAVIISVAMLLFNTFFLSWRGILFFLHLGIISVLYNIPEKMVGKTYSSIRKIPLLKIFLIAYVWSTMGTFYPAIAARQTVFTTDSILLFLAKFCFILAITFPFDIRDFYTDKKVSLRTIPGKIGITGTKALAVFSLLAFMLIIGSLGFNPVAILSFGFLCLYLIMASRPDKPDWYYTGLIDGTIIVYFFAFHFRL